MSEITQEVGHPQIEKYKSQYRVLPPRASMTAWQRRLMLLTSLLKLFWGSSFHYSTTATGSSGRSRGCRERAWRRLLSWSQPCSSVLRSGDSAGHSMWRQSDLLDTSSYDISTVRGRVVLHKDEIWCVLTMLWNNNWIYDIPEVGSASHSPIYDNQISVSLGSLTSTPPAALTAIISVKGDPGFISENTVRGVICNSRLPGLAKSERAEKWS